MRAAAAIWFLFASVLLAVFVGALGQSDQGPASLVLAAGVGVTSAWLGWQLWRNPSLPIVIVSVCVAGFVVFLWLVAMVGGSFNSLWAWLVPLLAAAAAALALSSRAERRP
jgi:hypothetical protein